MDERILWLFKRNVCYFGDNSGYVGALRRSTKVTQWGSEATRKKKKKNKEQFQRINVLTIKWKRKEKEKKKNKKKKKCIKLSLLVSPLIFHLLILLLTVQVCVVQRYYG